MNTSDYKSSMEKAIKHLEGEFCMLQVGRASTGLVENIDVFVPSWGMKQKMNQLANITIIDAQTIKVEPWDRGIISAVEKGVYDSGTGLSPVNQGTYLYIKIPPLTKERRQDLTKVVSKLGEEAKISIRNVRHDAMAEIKKEFTDKTISEDQKKSFESEIDDIVKGLNAKIDVEVKNKSSDIMTI